MSPTALAVVALAVPVLGACVMRGQRTARTGPACFGSPGVPQPARLDRSTVVPRYAKDGSLRSVDVTLIDPCGWYVGGLMWVMTVDTARMLPSLDPSTRILRTSIPAETWHRLPAVFLVRLGWGFGGGRPLFYVIRREIVPPSGPGRSEPPRGIVPVRE